jgi:hypothetical protein
MPVLFLALDSFLDLKFCTSIYLAGVSFFSTIPVLKWPVFLYNGLKFLKEV